MWFISETTGLDLLNLLNHDESDVFTCSLSNEILQKSCEEILS